MSKIGVGNLKDLVSKDIWNVIKDNYERGNNTR